MDRPQRLRRPGRAALRVPGVRRGQPGLTACSRNRNPRLTEDKGSHYDSSVINGTVDALKDQFGLGGFAVGFVVSAALLGCAAGAWFAGPVGDRIGRVRVMLIASVLFVISSLGSALAFSAVDLTFWRLVGGLAIGAASVIAPAYIAEIAPAELRGRLGSLQQMAIVLGIFAALVVNYVIAQVPDGGATGTFPLGGGEWRWMFASCVVPAVMYGVIATTIPESPRPPQGPARRPPRPAADRLGRHPAVGLPAVRRHQRDLLLLVLAVAGGRLLRERRDTMLTSVINSIVNVAFTLVAIAFVDRVGRRPLLLAGAAGMAVSLGALTACFATAPIVDGDPKLGGVAGPVALVAANVFVASFAATWGPVVWVMLGEMFDNFIRASALAVAAAAQWLANWVITTTFPGISGFSLGLAHGLYTLFSILAFVFVIRAVPETKGRELGDMDRLAAPRARV
ncbi:MFS transporter [Spirillospora sp. CA-142024]|uniref:MFS transporter n=1 Tax=Spirillospora sp. CA-142024 TaxID=3240036 RepID=UPI003D8ACFFF